MKLLSATCAILFLCLLAPLTASSYTESLLGITFPEQLTNMERTQITDYEAKNPGGGTGISYRGKMEKADFYVYNNGKKTFPTIWIHSRSTNTFKPSWMPFPDC